MKKKVKIFSTIVLSLALLFSICFNVNAEEQYTITVNGAGKDHKFEAYQVFKGDLSTSNVDGKEIDVLSNIQWGEGVQGDALLNGLKASQDTVNEILSNGAPSSNVKPLSEIFQSCNTARDVAEILALYQDNSDMIIAFAEVVNEHLTQTKLDAQYSDATKNYTFTTSQAGYYFVKDTTEELTNPNEFYTRYILKVVKNAEVKVKGDIPTLEKKVANTGKENDDTSLEHDDNHSDEKKALSAEIGEALEFTLYGTLPTNYKDYKTYKYIFHDTLSKGLTLKNDSIKVYKVTKDAKEEITECPTSDDNTKKCYKRQITSPTEPDNATELTITIENLKEIIADSDYTEEKDYKIVVTYFAYLNKDAIVGNEGNTNKAHLEYSNNPNKSGKDETGNTPEETNTVYTYQLDINKQDGKKEIPLDGVGFKLYKKIHNEGSKDKILYAVMEDKTGEENQYNVLKEWTDNENEATEIFTYNGGNLSIKGLKAGTYYLKETTTLPGYNTIDDVVITITESLTGNDKNDVLQDLSNLELTVEWMDNQKTKSDETAQGNKETGIVKTTILNMPGSILPFTGGAGTVIFYTVGIILIVVAGVLIYKNIKGSKSNKDNNDTSK